MCTCVGDAVTESGKSPEQPSSGRAFPCIECRTPGLPPACMTKPFFSPPELRSVMSLLYPVFPELTAVPFCETTSDVQGGGERGAGLYYVFFGLSRLCHYLSTV